MKFGCRFLFKVQRPEHPRKLLYATGSDTFWLFTKYAVLRKDFSWTVFSPFRMTQDCCQLFYRSEDAVPFNSCKTLTVVILLHTVMNVLFIELITLVGSYF